MDIKSKIEAIVQYIFSKFGESENFSGKERLLIHDNVHGTLEFDNSERRIINSPLLQRLTHIHQMRLAHCVYPGAVHNRFTHSLGVARLAGKIYENVKRDHSIGDKILSLRLAGLLHDIDHGPFSHVTDTKLNKLLVALPSHRKEKIRIDYDIYLLAEKFAKKKNNHEIISYHMIRSKSVQDLVNEIYSPFDPNLDLVSLCITGNEMPYPDEKGSYQGRLSESGKFWNFIEISNFL